MVVTRDAFRTLGAADDPDSTVPCQLPVRVCELDGGDFRRTKGSTTACYGSTGVSCLSRSCLVSRKPARVSQGGVLLITSATSASSIRPCQRIEIHIALFLGVRSGSSSTIVEFPPRAGDNLHAGSTSAHPLQDRRPNRTGGSQRG